MNKMKTRHDADSLTASLRYAPQMAATGTNLYAWCGNNPVSRVDNSGQSWLSDLIVRGARAVVNIAAGIGAGISGAESSGGGRAYGLGYGTGSRTRRSLGGAITVAKSVQKLAKPVARVIAPTANAFALIYQSMSSKQGFWERIIQSSSPKQGYWQNNISVEKFGVGTTYDYSNGDTYGNLSGGVSIAPMNYSSGESSSEYQPGFSFGFTWPSNNRFFSVEDCSAKISYKSVASLTPIGRLYYGGPKLDIGCNEKESLPDVSIYGQIDFPFEDR